MPRVFLTPQDTVDRVLFHTLCYFLVLWQLVLNIVPGIGFLIIDWAIFMNSSNIYPHFDKMPYFAGNQLLQCHPSSGLTLHSIRLMYIFTQENLTFYSRRPPGSWTETGRL